MGWTPILAFAVIAVVFGIGDVIAIKTKGVISSVITAILLFLILGGTLKLLPPDLMAMSGLPPIITTFGMGLILVNVGSMMDLNDLVREWKTVLVSIAGIVGIVAIDATLGAMLFGWEQAMISTAPTAGGMVATMMLTNAATEAGRADLAAFVAATMALQMLIGVPISSFCLRKEAKRFLNAGLHRVSATGVEHKKISLRFLPATPADWDTPSLQMARLAAVGVIGLLCTQLTGISTGVTFLLFGVFFTAIGFLEKGSLKKAGGEGLLMLATYVSVTASFVSMSLAQFGKMLLPVVGLLLFGAVGVTAFSVVAGKLLKWSPWISIAVGLSCMFGYPVTYAISMEISGGATRGKGYTPEEEQRLVDHILPKMLIAGMVSVSIASVILASIVIPIVFA